MAKDVSLHNDAAQISLVFFAFFFNFPRTKLQELKNFQKLVEIKCVDRVIL